MSIQHLRSAIARSRPALVCIDVFDTLLLRGADREVDRIRRLGRLVEMSLSADGIYLPPGAGAATRTAASHAVYRAAARSETEARHADMLRLQCLALGLAPDRSDQLARIELGQEVRDLRPNLSLAEVLRASRREGARVVAVSDMYLPGASILHLLASAGVADCVDHVYASSDIGLTKRRGDLFRHVLEAEGVAPDEAVHAGDCRIADYLMPTSHGIAAVHLPRHRVELVRALRRLAHRYMGTMVHA